MIFRNSDRYLLRPNLLTISIQPQSPAPHIRFNSLPRQIFPLAKFGLSIYPPCFERERELKRLLLRGYLHIPHNCMQTLLTFFEFVYSSVLIHIKFISRG